ncbi:MAG TPA: hypothetical protein VNW68_05010 [Candidatus Limnocylindria bacterium]|nr:hypothetical protein [Candidatus Limnocylindria bacterium]
MSQPPAQQHTGVVRRGSMRRQPSGPDRRNWLALLLVGGLGMAVVLAVLAGDGPPM